MCFFSAFKYAGRHLKKTIFVVIAFIFIFSCINAGTSSVYADTATTENVNDTALPVEWPSAPEIKSGAAILMDADTGAVLYEKNSREKNYPASTTKILTGLLVCRNAGLSEKVTFSKAAAQSVEYGDSSLSTKEGEVYTVEQALYGLLLHSANEIAYGLAEHVSGSLDDFVKMMNDTALSLGAKDTHFANASGLYDANHYTTAYDMALIARTCFNNPTFLTIDATARYEIAPTNLSTEPRSFYNRNLLLPERTYGYEYCVGGKTGYVPEGGYTYVSYAEKEGMRLIFVCFKSTADDRFYDAKNMFEWGFDNFTKVSLSGSSITAPFTDTSFLSSKRYNTGNITKSFNASFVTVPASAGLSGVSLSGNSQESVGSDEDSLTLPVVFNYGDHVAGTATLSYSSSEKDSKSTGMLPMVDSSAKKNYQINKAFVIDLRILITIGAIALGIYIIVYARKKHIEKINQPKWKRNKYY